MAVGIRTRSSPATPSPPAVFEPKTERKFCVLRKSSSRTAGNCPIFDGAEQGATPEYDVSARIRFSRMSHELKAGFIRSAYVKSSSGLRTGVGAPREFRIRRGTPDRPHGDGDRVRMVQSSLSDLFGRERRPWKSSKLGDRKSKSRHSAPERMDQV